MSINSVWSQNQVYTLNDSTFNSFNNYLFWERCDDILSPDQAYHQLINIEQKLINSNTINDGNY